LRLSEFLGNESFQHVKGEKLDLQVTAISDQSTHVQPGSVFFAYRGQTSDGHKYIESAIQNGAVALVVENLQSVPDSFLGPVYQVKHGKKSLSLAAAMFYGRPSAKLFCVGVTGTNGKTTVTHMVEHILNHRGSLTGVMGTIDHHVGSHRWSAQLTTPGPVELYQRLKDFVSLGAKAVSMEISSHALIQGRVEGLQLDVAVMTNLTRDHLDFHNSMEDYFEAKKILFAHVLKSSSKRRKSAILNIDNVWCQKLRSTLENVDVWTYGKDSDDIKYKIVEQTFEGSRVALSGKMGTHELQLSLPCEHNVQNALAAFAVGLSAGYPAPTLLEDLITYPGVKGRLEPIQNHRNLHVFVDYAHTDDALKSVLQSLVAIKEQFQPKPRIITVFGCGGDRDKGKRPLMAQAALAFSDLVVVTSDNPRTEDPEKIISDILSETSEHEKKTKVFVEVQRKEALKLAIAMAKKDDVILVAGKGHEEYQVLGHQKVSFSDQEILRELLK